jgi:phytoene dehydrogenase-like protein
MEKYDVIIIGAGPNGLAVGSYLAKAGVKLLILERRLEAGGGLATEEVTLPGFLHNTHSIYHMMVDYAPIYNDLRLEEKYGLKHIFPPLQCSLLLKDGRSLCLYTDLDKTCESIAQFSKRDSDVYREVCNKFEQFTEDYLAPATYDKAHPPLLAAAKLQASDWGSELMSYSSKSPKEIVDELFENEHVRTMWLYNLSHWGLQYNMQGMGYLALLYFNRAANYRIVVGGSHMVSQAICKVIVESGGMIWGSQRIKCIIMENGSAKGVELQDGRVIEAKVVVSSIDPYQTFFSLVGEENLEPDFAERLQDYKWEKWSLITAHLALESAPNFTAAASNPEINQSLIYLLGYETPEDLIRHWEAIDNGEPCEDEGFECSFPSIHDPSQAPKERHVGLITQMAPYNLKEGGAEKWYDFKFKEEQMARRLETLAKYAPNIKDSLLWHSICTPLDIENKFLDMVQGSYKQGAYLPFQLGFNRPNEFCSGYRTPIKDLYLCGSSCHPGGMVIWGAGYNAAGVIAEDLGVEKWWSEPEIVLRSREKGLM